MKTSIKIENLNHFYGQKELQKQVLFDINLEIKAGEIVILTGPSGSGKTTLLSLIGALRSVQNGSLQELNQELYGASEEQLVQIRPHIGYIFQAHNLLPFLTARENVQMSIELHENISKKQAIAKSEAILKEVGLGERINYYPDNLSGGQKQRVAIARALVSHPSIVLADEPTAALDKKTGRDVVNLMQILAKEQHCTILLVTHDDRILDIADRVIRMEDGRLNTATNLLTTNSKK
ncbi:MAG: DevA family ABC transporter ATP-binding protein [Dolichospermum sp.]